MVASAVARAMPHDENAATGAREAPFVDPLPGAPARRCLGRRLA